MALLHPEEFAHNRAEGRVIPSFRPAPAQVADRAQALDALTCANPGVGPEKLAPAHVKGNIGQGVRGSRAFLDRARKPEIIDLVSGAIGDDVIRWRCHEFCKPAAEGYETPWHQDGYCGPIRPLANCTVWVALEPSTVENGCLQAIPTAQTPQRPNAQSLLANKFFTRRGNANLSCCATGA